jgi:hypothetical protein
VDSVKAPELVNNGLVTEVVKLGALVIDKLLQEPPLPKVMLLPPPLRLPVPDAQVIEIFPCTAVLAPEPYRTLKVGVEPSPEFPVVERPVRAPRSDT